jgi:hypothetical protein
MISDNLRPQRRGNPNVYQARSKTSDPILPIQKAHLKFRKEISASDAHSVRRKSGATSMMPNPKKQENRNHSPTGHSIALRHPDLNGCFCCGIRV